MVTTETLELLEDALEDTEEALLEDTDEALLEATLDDTEEALLEDTLDDTDEELLSGTTVVLPPPQATRIELSTNTPATALIKYFGMLAFLLELV